MGMGGLTGTDKSVKAHINKSTLLTTAESKIQDKHRFMTHDTINLGCTCNFKPCIQLVNFWEVVKA